MSLNKYEAAPIGAPSLNLDIEKENVEAVDRYRRELRAKTTSRCQLDNGRVARTSLFLSAAVWLVFGGCLVLLGIAARASPGATAERALFVGLFELLPHELASIATVAILAALMSTIDTEVFLLASMVAKEFVGRRREMTQDEMARVIRLAMVGVAVPAILIAIYWPSILGVLFILLSLLMALFPVILVSLLRPLTPGVAFASILTGTLLVMPAFCSDGRIRTPRRSLS